MSFLDGIWLEHVVWWAALVIGLAGTTLYSGMETGLYCLNRVRLALRAAHGPRRWSARVIDREMSQPERMLGANLIANLICGDMAATGAARLMAMAGYSDTAIIVANAIILTPVFFVMVESVPKELFRVEADRATYRFAWLLPATRWALTVVPALPLVRGLTEVASRLLGGRGDAGLEQSARERVASLIKDSAGTGALSESQATLVDRALAFRQRAVSREMQAWSEVATIEAGASLGELREAVERVGARFVAVVEGDGPRRGHVIGMIWHADAYLRAEVPVRQMMFEPARLTPRTPLPEAMATLRQRRVAVGVVEDGGRPVGLVTMDDLIEPLLIGGAKEETR